MNPIDRLIEQSLDRDAGGVDAQLMLLRVRGVEVRRAWMRRALTLGGAAIAASVGGMLLVGPGTSQALASAEAIITESQAVHALPTDRLYEVSTEWEPAALKRMQIPPVNRMHRVWTRGDVFWAQPDDAPWCLGQEKSGRVWFAIGRKRGLTYDSSEMSEPHLKFLDLISLRLVSTLAELLEKFQLLRKDHGQPGEPIRIEAEMKPNFLNRNPRFQSIKLVLDPQTKVVREASFERKFNGESVGRMRFVLKDTAILSDRDYELRGHLDADAEIIDRNDGLRNDRRAKWRDDFLKRLQSRPTDDKR